MGVLTVPFQPDQQIQRPEQARFCPIVHLPRFFAQILSWQVTKIVNKILPPSEPLIHGLVLEGNSRQHGKVLGNWPSAMGNSTMKTNKFSASLPLVCA